MAIDYSKLTTLAQLKTGLQAAKAYTDEQDLVLSGRIDEITTTIEGIVSVGGEANILNGVKVNGTALAIADKMVDILIEAGSENGTIAVNGVDVAITGLQALAFKAQVSESDLDDALKAVIAAKATQSDLEALGARVTDIEGAGYQTAAQVATAIQAAVSASGHAHFEKVDAVPAAADAEENVLYLVMNAETNHYDIYALVSGEVVLIDDTTVDLSAYSTTEQMNAAIQTAIEAIGIGDYAKAADLADAVNRIAAVEAKFDEYYTIAAADAKFATKDELNAVDAKFDNYSTTEEMNAAIKVVDDKFANYSTTEEMGTAIGAALEDYSTTEEMNTTLAGYATDEEAATAASTAVSNATATDAEVETMLDEVFG